MRSWVQIPVVAPKRSEIASILTMIHILFFLSIIALSIGLLYLVKKWPDGGIHATFSHHAASTDNATKYYVSLFLATLPPFVIWFVVWFVPRLDLPIAAVAMVCIAALAQIWAAAVPERSPTISRHRAITGLSIAGILSVTLMVVYSSQSWLVGFCLVCMLIILVYAASRGDRSRYPLLLQAGFYTMFFVALGSFIAA